MFIVLSRNIVKPWNRSFHLLSQLVLDIQYIFHIERFISDVSFVKFTSLEQNFWKDEYYFSGKGAVSFWTLGVQRDPNDVSQWRSYKWYWSDAEIPNSEEYWTNRYVPSGTNELACGYVNTDSGDYRLHDHSCSSHRHGLCEWWIVYESQRLIYYLCLSSYNINFDVHKKMTNYWIYFQTKNKNAKIRLSHEAKVFLIQVIKWHLSS